MSGLRVTLSSSGVHKLDLPGCEGSVDRQVRHLQTAALLGLRIPPLRARGPGWALWAEIQGPTMAEAEVTPERLDDLRRLVLRMECADRYVGDLHGGNLVWSSGGDMALRGPGAHMPMRGWVVVDCGATRPPRDRTIRERLARKWRKTPQWLPALQTALDGGW